MGDSMHCRCDYAIAAGYPIIQLVIAGTGKDGIAALRIRGRFLPEKPEIVPAVLCNIIFQGNGFLNTPVIIRMAGIRRA